MNHRASPPCRALVADDEEDFRGLLVLVLTDAGWEVVEAEDGDQALQALLAHSFDVALLDHRMPGLTGSEVYRQLRASGREVPVILMTAASQIQEIATALGITEYIGKPLNLDDLFQAIRRASGCEV